MLIDKINAILPQTQCRLCGFQGCKPYATALANKTAPINLCPPGGVAGLKALGTLCGEDPTPYIEDMRAKTRAPQMAVIREAECIGCMKCIQACPVDAIIGTAKWMHTVIQAACTGCELCLPPCPVDCIELAPNPSSEQDKREQYKQHYEARQQRLAHENRQSTVISDKKSYLMQILLRSRKSHP